MIVVPTDGRIFDDPHGVSFPCTEAGNDDIPRFHHVVEVIECSSALIPFSNLFGGIWTIIFPTDANAVMGQAVLTDGVVAGLTEGNFPHIGLVGNSEFFVGQFGVRLLVDGLIGILTDLLENAGTNVQRFGFGSFR